MPARQGRANGVLESICCRIFLTTATFCAAFTVHNFQECIYAMQAALMGVDPCLAVQKGHDDEKKFGYRNRKGKDPSLSAECTVVSHLLYKKYELEAAATADPAPDAAILSLAKAVEVADRHVLSPSDRHHITGVTCDLLSGGWVLALLQDYNPVLLHALVRPLSLSPDCPCAPLVWLTLHCTLYPTAALPLPFASRVLAAMVGKPPED